VPGNAWAPRGDGKCNRNIPPMAVFRGKPEHGSGKGEIVR
jgi:hypothetical protein